MALLPGDDGPYIFASKVPREYDGKCLIDYLAGRFAYQDRATWLSRIAAGDVLIEGVAETEPARIVAKERSIEYVHGAYTEPDTPTDWKVVAISEEWMAVSKPSGMPMHSTSRIFRQTLAWQVRKMFGEGWAPVHRLDRETSGIVLFARGPVTSRWLYQAFSQRTVSKEYIALVHGELLGEMDVNGPIGPVGDPLIPIRQAVVEGGKDACTSVRPIGPDALGRGTWVVASPKQGRMHQIRVHCESIGHPIVGDPLYDGLGGEGFKSRVRGEPASECSGLVGGERLHLHAWKLRFDRSGPGEMPRSLECPIRAGWSVPF